MDEGRVRCTECKRQVDEFEAISERWAYWSDGRDLLPYCPGCSEREFGGEAKVPVPFAQPRAKTIGS